MDSMEQTRKLAPDHWIRGPRRWSSTGSLPIAPPEHRLITAGRVQARLDQVLGTKPVASPDDRFSVHADIRQDGYRHVSFSFFFGTRCGGAVPPLDSRRTGVSAATGRGGAPGPLHRHACFRSVKRSTPARSLTTMPVLIDHGEDYAVRGREAGVRGAGDRTARNGKPQEHRC